MNAAGLDDSNLNAIVLAGGDGTRLAALTRRISGQEIPKQFCPIFENTTLLEQTMRRVSMAVRRNRTLIVLSRQHERFYKSFSCKVAEENLVLQPHNRGTAAAILYALFCLIRQGRRGRVAIFPSDHYVSDDRRFMLYVEAASSVVSEVPDRIVLLGIPADKPESQYGWIEPGQPLNFNLMGIGPVLRIRRFWEKPSPDVAIELWRRGFFWNSFVMVARIEALLDLFAGALPQLYVSFAQLFAFVGAARETETTAIAQLYDNIPSVSFSDDILTEFCVEFLVLPVRGVQWSDLGEPTRVLNIIAELGLHPKWLPA
jgi:mannose-1-phosphate guanylyltransferase